MNPDGFNVHNMRYYDNNVNEWCVNMDKFDGKIAVCCAWAYFIQIGFWKAMDICEFYDY